MDRVKQIKKQKQLIARDEKALAIAKIKKRKADTRRKIELGGLVIKSGIDGYSKSTILGALIYALALMNRDKKYTLIFMSEGEKGFVNCP